MNVFRNRINKVCYFGDYGRAALRSYLNFCNIQSEGGVFTVYLHPMLPAVNSLNFEGAWQV